MFPLVPRGTTGSICLKSLYNHIQIPHIGWLLPIKSCRVQSRASNACILIIVASSTAMALADFAECSSTFNATDWNVHSIQI